MTNEFLVMVHTYIDNYCIIYGEGFKVFGLSMNQPAFVVLKLQLIM